MFTIKLSNFCNFGTNTSDLVKLQEPERWKIAATHATNVASTLNSQSLLHKPLNDGSMKKEGLIFSLTEVCRSSPVHRRVPASSQRQVDDHVHRDQISHCIVAGPHGAQDALPRLITQQRYQRPALNHVVRIASWSPTCLLTAIKTPLGPLKLSIQPWGGRATETPQRTFSASMRHLAEWVRVRLLPVVVANGGGGTGGIDSRLQLDPIKNEWNYWKTDGWRF